MTQSTKLHDPAPTPRAASRRRSPLDRALDPVVFKALSDPTRCRLFACLAKCARPCSVTELAECCSVDFSVVSRHMVTLATAELVSYEKRGRVVWYAVEHARTASRFRGLADALSVCAPGDGCCGDSDCACDDAECP